MTAMEVVGRAMRLIDQLRSIDDRLERIERLLRGNSLPAETALSGGDGTGFEWTADPSSHHRYPKCWHDRPVRDAVIRMHRTTTIDGARAKLVAEFGEDRAPSASALHRIWQRIDQTA